MVPPFFTNVLRCGIVSFRGDVAETLAYFSGRPAASGCLGVAGRTFPARSLSGSMAPVSKMRTSNSTVEVAGVEGLREDGPREEIRTVRAASVSSRTCSCRRTSDSPMRTGLQLEGFAGRFGTSQPSKSRPSSSTIASSLPAVDEPAGM